MVLAKKSMKMANILVVNLKMESKMVRVFTDGKINMSMMASLKMES